MCKFFSFMTNGENNPFYFRADRRKELLTKANPLGLNPDSHSSIANQFALMEDRMNKYEYNPLTGVFTKDQINVKDDSLRAEKWVKKLDFKTIVPELVIKPIINPFSIDPPEIGEKQIQLLKQWGSVRDSVRDSVLDSVRDSVGDSVWDLVRDSVRDLVRDSVWDSVGDSVRDSVRDSVYAYLSSFVNLPKWKYIDHEEGKNPFQSCIDLWEQGIVPSFDGTTWRLHTKNGIAYEIKKEELIKST